MLTTRLPNQQVPGAVKKGGRKKRSVDRRLDTHKRVCAPVYAHISHEKGRRLWDCVHLHDVDLTKLDDHSLSMSLSLHPTSPLLQRLNQRLNSGSQTRWARALPLGNTHNPQQLWGFEGLRVWLSGQSHMSNRSQTLGFISSTKV